MNKQTLYRALLCCMMLWVSLSSPAQTDTTKPFVPLDSLPSQSSFLSDTAAVKAVMRTHSPRKATFRSLVLPGWGQIYNRKYWKLPIIYGALGVSGGVFLYNLQWYRRTRFAYRTLTTRDTNNYSKIHPRLQVFVQRNEPSSLQNLRNSYRRDIDYSFIAFLLLWGLNVVDATVDAHLKSFDVGPDLGFRIKVGHSELGGTNGVSLILAFK